MERNEMIGIIVEMKLECRKVYITRMLYVLRVEVQLFRRMYDVKVIIEVVKCEW